MTKKNNHLTFEELKKKLASYLNKEEIEEIESAYQFIKEFHLGEKRLSGEDYIVHPLNIAYILAEINADSKTICAGLLHDVLEKGTITKEELEKRFGAEVASLVDGVTVINKLSFNGETKSIQENNRKILVGLSEDVRVIIIKFADRLHNMRTLWAIPEESRKEKAKETLDILVPIASRLGMNSFKSELEDLSLRYYKPDVYFSIVEALNETKLDRDQAVKDMIEAVSKLLDENHIKYKIKGRSKSIYSIYKKLDKGKKFSEIYDLYALRVYVNTEQECYQVLGIIHGKFKPIPRRFKDYIAMPKTNMYQSLHTTVFGVDEHIFEIQIRTYEMDEIAERGIASHWSYKEHGSVKAEMQDTMEKKLQFFRSLMEIKESSNEEDFVQNVQDEVLNENVYVFTPNGDVIELPQGSTPIDFAYRVHSNVGDKMVGAIVNGSIVPLDYELKTNDIVKINTNKNSSGPSQEWLSIARTAQARNKIKGFFNRTSKERYLKNGDEILNKELKKRKISQSQFFQNENIDKILKEFKYNTLDELLINIGNNKLPVSQIFHFLLEDTPSKEELILKKVTQKKEISINTEDDIIVKGIDKIKTNIASCCRPVPGDHIVGYITKGNGVSIHRSICPNISDVEERIIEVEWNQETKKKYASTLLVQSREGKNIFMGILAKMSNTEVQIQSINTLSSSENNLYELVITVENLEQLQKIIKDLEQIPDILNIERIVK